MLEVYAPAEPCSNLETQEAWTMMFNGGNDYEQHTPTGDLDVFYLYGI
jgi:hypothetical protein